MPKIIKNLERNLLEEAKRQITESGYAAMTIRSVAKGCGVGVGTVYNYFPSKEAMIATYLLEDWSKSIAAINAVGTYSDQPSNVLRCMYDELCRFAQQHKAVFEDEAAASGFAGSFSRYHSLLRGQLAAPLRKFCCDDFTAEFVAEALLTWTTAGKPFNEIYGILQKLF